MIAVIIVTKNKNYSVLEVPSNGRLVIMERHLICGIVQNGVKMIPYGNVLYPFETFLFNNTMSVEMIPAGVWRPEGRVLDFAAIELLQAFETVHPSNSGSSQPYQEEIYYSKGYKIDYNFKLNLRDYEINDEGDLEGIFHPNTVVNGWAKQGDFYLLSVPLLKTSNYLSNEPDSGYLRLGQVANDFCSYFEDLKGSVKVVEGEEFRGFEHLTDVILPECVTLGNTTFNSYEIKNIYLPKVQNIGATTGDSNVFLGVNYQYSGSRTGFTSFDPPTVTVPRIHETSNGGAMEGDLLRLVNQVHGANIVFVD